MPDLSRAQNLNELFAMMLGDQCDSCKKNKITHNCTVKGAWKQVKICPECLKENTDFYEVNNE